MCFLSRNASEQNSRSLLLFCLTGQEFRVVFSSENRSEQNSESLLLFCSTEPNSKLFSLPQKWFGTEFREFSVPRNRQNSVRTNHLFLLSRLSQNYFSSEISNPTPPPPGSQSSAGIFKQSMGARNGAGIGLSYRPARLHSLAELVPWNQKFGLRTTRRFYVFTLSAHVAILRIPSLTWFRFLVLTLSAPVAMLRIPLLHVVPFPCPHLIRSRGHVENSIAPRGSVSLSSPYPLPWPC